MGAHGRLVMAVLAVLLVQMLDLTRAKSYRTDTGSRNLEGNKTMKRNLQEENIMTSASKAPKEFDCEIRKLAVEYAFKIQPFRPKSFFTELVAEINAPGGLPDGEMQCAAATMPDHVPDSYRPRFEIPATRRSYFVDATNGNDQTNDGSISKPFATAKQALDAIRKVRANNPGDAVYGIVFRQGRHYVTETLSLGPEDSNLTFQNYNGEEVWISGAIPVPFGGTTKRIWKQHPSQASVWVMDLADTDVKEMTGLRINGKRAVRARYPNGCTSDTPLPSGYSCKGYQEGNKVVDPRDGFGSNLLSKSWVLPEQPTTHQEGWRQITVENPLRKEGTAYHSYQIGVGGTCDVYDPPAGYWCGLGCWGGSYRPPRCITRWPAGVEVGGLLPNGPYENVEDAIVQVWHPGHWASWAFELDVNLTNATHLMFSRGGFQDGRGENTGESFFVENVREELDADNEFFFDKKQQELLYVSSTGAPPADGVLEIPTLRTFLDVHGTQSKPVNNLHVLGLGFRDSRLTYMDKHTMVSGGDWGLNKVAAIVLRGGTNDAKIDSCVFEELDGNAIHIQGYARGLMVQNSDFHVLGGNMISLLGETEGETLPSEWGIGWNGTAGNQPRGSVIRNNVGYRCGLFMKQTAFIFQGKSMETLVQNNILFHSPRAAINLNDGFGGANVFEGNLIFNTVKETGDHGPFNSWDRQPFAYGFDVKTGEYLMAKKSPDEIRANFMIGNYYSQENIDNDDGSQTFNTHHNVFVYGENGLKTDFFGHSNIHHDNLYAYCGGKGAVAGQDVTQPGQQDQFYSNTVVMLKNGAYVDFPCKCNLSDNTCTKLANNQIFTPDGTSTELTCGHTMAELVSLGYDSGTTYASWPAIPVIIKKARKLLGLDEEDIHSGLLFSELAQRS